MQYDQLTVVQWGAGYCRILREEQNPQVKEHMIDYLIALMEDAHDLSWDAARASQCFSAEWNRVRSKIILKQKS